MKTQQTLTLPRMAALKAEAVAEANHQPVPEALCEVCGRPSQSWVVEQYALVTQDLNNEIIKRGQENRELKAEKATLQTRVERLEDDLEQCQRNHYIAAPDGGLPVWFPAALALAMGVMGVFLFWFVAPIVAAYFFGGV